MDQNGYQAQRVGVGPRDSCKAALNWLRILLGGTVLTLTAAISSAESVIVTDVSGSKVTGELGVWSDKKMTILGDRPKEFELRNLRSIIIDRPILKSAQPGFMIWLSNGDRIAAQAVTVTNDLLVATWPALGSASPPSISLEKVTAIILELPITLNERLRLFADIESFPPGSDVVMLSNGDRSQGEFQKLDASFVELKGPSSVLKIDRNRVRAIRMNPDLTTALRPNARRTIVSLNDGSRISASELVLENRHFKVKSPVLGELTLPVQSVAACQFFGSRVVPVSDYEPTKVEFTPYLSSTWTLARNANVLRGPLMLRGAESVIGLGMHSRMSVTYELRGNETAFQCQVGIDDAASGAGSAVFAVEVDGRRAWASGNLTGKSPATVVPEIDLRGAKRVTLLVDFGQFADVSDYADWCDAVFILERPR